jgi:hypothetical protein
MKTHAQASFAIQSWDERTWDGVLASDVSGEKLTRAQVSYTYQGDIEGTGTLQYLMTYRPDGTGNYVGLERIEGAVGRRSGSFVLQHTGTFSVEGVKGRVFVVPGSGTGGLKNLHGEGSLDLSGHQAQYPISLDYELE